MFDVCIADKVIFELLILTKLFVLVTAQRKDWVNDKYRDPEHEKDGVLQDVNKQNGNQIGFFQNRNCLDRWDKVHRLCKFFGVQNQFLPPNGRNSVTEDCSFHGPFKDGGPIAPFVSAESLEAAPAHKVVDTLPNKPAATKVVFIPWSPQVHQQVVVHHIGNRQCHAYWH